MKLRKIGGLMICLLLLLIFAALPASANASTEEDVAQLIHSFPGIIDSLETQEYTFWTLVFDYINLRSGYSASYAFNSKEMNVVAAQGLDIAKLHIQVIDAEKKIIAETSGKNPLLEFAVPQDGDYTLIFTAEALRPGAKRGLSSYFGYLLEWK